MSERFGSVIVYRWARGVCIMADTDVRIEQLFKLDDEIRAGRIDRAILHQFLERPQAFNHNVGRWGRIWPVTIDGNLSVEKHIDLGNYGWKNPEATADHFPYLRSGHTKVNVELAEFDDTVTGPEAEEWLDNNGYKLEDSDALLNFGSDYPIEQRRRPIVCIGKNSRWLGPGRLRYVLCLDNGLLGRGLCMCSFGNRFALCCRFLVSPK